MNSENTETDKRKEHIKDALGRAHRLALVNNWLDAKLAIQEASLIIHSMRPNDLADNSS